MVAAAGTDGMGTPGLEEVFVSPGWTICHSARHTGLLGLFFVPEEAFGAELEAASASRCILFLNAATMVSYAVLSLLFLFYF